MIKNYDLKRALLAPFELLYKIAPQTEIKLMYFLKHKRMLDLKHPKAYTEKIQWIKFFDPCENFARCSDKFLVRQYITDIGCPEILNELLWSGFDPEQIPFDLLPEQFVIKTTHGSGFNIICHDKSKLDRDHTIRQLKKWLGYEALPCYGEWWYGVEKPRIVIEKMLSDPEQEILYDYKVLCFEGEPRCIWVVFDRFSDLGPQSIVVDTEWNILEDVCFAYPLRDRERIPRRPEKLAEMLDYARKIAAGFPQLRVDMYVVQNKVVFGEMTFSHGAGFDRIEPYSFDLHLGSLFRLPGEK